MVKKLDCRTISKLKYYSKVLSVLIAIFGFIIILGWAFNIPLFKSPGPAFSTVKSNLAICFILIGISLFLLQTRIINKSKQKIIQFSGFVVLLTGFLTLIQYFFALDLGIDQMFFREAPGAINTLSPNRMEIVAALNLFLAGTAILLLEREVHRQAQYLGVVVGILALLALTCHIYGVSGYYMIYAGTAVYAAVIFTLISLAILFARPDKSIMRLFTGTGAGSSLAWKIIPMVFIIPLLTGYFIILGKIMNIDTYFGITVLIITLIIISLVLSGISLNSLNEIDYKHYEAEENTKRLADIVKSSEDGIISMDLNYIISSWNRGAQKIYGYSAPEVIGKHKSILMGPSEWKNASKLLKKVKEGEAVSQYEAKRLRKDGREVDVSLTLSPVKNYEGEITGISVIYRDITEQKKSEEKLKETVEELKHTSDELQQFAYITSHDLQEPLRTIASFAQLLKIRYKNRLDPDADEFIDFVVDAAKHMKKMIQGLLDYSRVSAQRYELKQVNSEKILNTVLSNLQPTIEKNKAQITHDKLPLVTADETQFIQLFQNLIGNAIKFKKEDVPPKIHISCKKDDEGKYIFSVSDNGIGIEPQYRDRIFEVFKRLHTIDEYRGAGIGLAISKRIVECHGGRIWVESELGRGSAFYFTIGST
ncbi:MAG: PAS domain S-box protein [Methanobacterium sp.]|jgi:PAS domain S-box-containing protein